MRNMDWDMGFKLFKVMCGNSVRRFASYVDGNGNLDLNMEGLRAKIISLFEFNPDADLILTYIDEDDDVITLVDEDEFLDAIRQSLNPLRIFVNNLSKRSNTKSGNSSAQQMTPEIKKPPSDIEESQSKALSDPLSCALIRLDNILVSLAKFSVPAFTEFVEDISELAFSKLDTISQHQNNASCNPENSNSNTDTKSKWGLETTKDITSMQKVLSGNESGQRGLETDNRNGVRTPFLDRNRNSAQRNQIPLITRNSSESLVGFSPQYICLTNAQPGICGLDVVLPEGNDVNESVEVNSISNSRTSNMGIQCDCCRVCQAIEPQFKVKYDHNQALLSFDGLDQLQSSHPISLPVHVSRDYGTKPYIRKLDSLFIQDVEVMDGAGIKASTCFKKIWRMRNNGAIVWPQEMLLVWVGGHNFMKEKKAILIQMPVDGLHVNDEVNIGVNFTAPDRLGRYTSYWRIALPSGYTFGQVIWVDIEVLYNDKGSSTDKFDNINDSHTSAGSCTIIHGHIVNHSFSEGTEFSDEDPVYEDLNEKGYSCDVEEVAYKYMNKYDQKTALQRKPKYRKG